MQEYNRNGHRQRMRNAYLTSGTDHMTDHQLLELYLSLVIPRRDVKELSYRMMNTFGSLEEIFNADPLQLESVDGIGENTAVLISLFREINSRIEYNRACNLEYLDSSSATKEYCRRMLSNAYEERILVISLTSKLKIINCHKLSSGTSSFVGVSPKTLMSAVLNDNAAQVVLAHNHPRGDAVFSAADINFTINLLGMLRTFNIRLVDHVLVGEDETVSMRSIAVYRKYFE